MSSPDRRVQRTRKLLQNAIVQLIREKGYDAITVQDILDRADVGRATFYAHYQSKEDLFLAHHDELIASLGLGQVPVEDLLSSDTPESLIAFLEVLAANRSLYTVIANSSDAPRMWRAFRATVAGHLVESLRSGMGEATPQIPIEVLSEYIASGQLDLIHWWMEQRSPCYSAAQLAGMLHRLRRVAIRDAFG